MTSENQAISPGRLKAEGFPLAPLLEAVLAVQFEGGLSDDEVDAIADTISEHYPNRILTPHREIKVDASANTVEIQEARKAYQLSGQDESEVLIVRPDGISVSQLAPYRSWNLLFDRFSRDLAKVAPDIVDRRIVRMAARYINRIDVPLVGREAQYEDYLAVHIRLPDDVPTIGPFHLRFELPTPEVGALATIQSGVLPTVVEGTVSMSLDIDVARTLDVPESRDEFLALFSRFRDVKNRLYASFLTEKAREEFK